MNVKQVVEALGGLAGGVWWSVGMGPRGQLRQRVDVQSVQRLAVDERLSTDVGNVILWDGSRCENGMPQGYVLWARDTVEVSWEDDGARVEIRFREGEAMLTRIGLYEGPDKASLIDVGRFKAGVLGEDDAE